LSGRRRPPEPGETRALSQELEQQERRPPARRGGQPVAEETKRPRRVRLGHPSGVAPAVLRARDAQLPACPNLGAYRALALAGELLVQGERTPEVARRIAVGGGRERVGPGPGEVVEGPRPLHRRRPVVCQPSVLARRKRLSRIARLERRFRRASTLGWH